MNRKWTMMNFRVLVFLALAMLLIAACGPVIPSPAAGRQQPSTAPTAASLPNTGNGVPSVTVSNQQYDGTTVTIADVVSAGPGWLVIHNQQNGVLGPPIGYTAVVAGDNKNVQVKIDPKQATSTMFAMLHTDAGTVGKYEFPGPDVPVYVNGVMVNPSFQATVASAGTGSSNITPTVIVKNQVVKNGTIIINEVDSNGPGWVAIHILGPDNKPSTDIGYTAVKSGKNTAVSVTIDPTKMTKVMFAMLHTDAGEIGMYEFPGPDGPQMVNGQMIAPAFTTDGSQLPAEFSANAPVAAAAAPTAAATAAATSAASPVASAATSAPAQAQPAGPTPTEENYGMGGMAMGGPGSAEPEVVVTDQPLVNGTVKAVTVTSNGPGWVVVYTTNANGQPDQPIGHAAVPNGETSDVVIPVDASKAQGTLYAQLHIDAGKVGTFEFPGPDAPVMVNVTMIGNQFKILSNQPPQGQANPPANPPANPNAPIVPSITVADQPIQNGMVIIPSAVSDSDAWLVIHRHNADGSMGGMVGFTHINKGLNTNIAVPVDTSLTSGIMYAMLHRDLGIKGKLEFPGPDVPEQVDGKDLTPKFTVTSNSNGDVILNLSQDTGNGAHVVNGQGMSLYISLNDSKGKSNCTGDCTNTWQPLIATGKIVAGPGIDSGRLGVVIRADNSRQVTYAGQPLYTYFKDTKPGDANGQGMDNTWFLVTP